MFGPMDATTLVDCCIIKGVDPVPDTSSYAEKRRWQRLPVPVPMFIRGLDEQGKEFLDFSILSSKRQNAKFEGESDFGHGF